jgi:hypothetical protein
MTVNTIATREFNIEKIVRRAYQLAGLVPAEQGTLSNAKSEMGRDFLEMTIDALQASGELVRQRDFETVAIVASTASYSMDSDILNVIEDGSFLLSTETTGATPVTPISMSEYQARPDKVSEGRPTNYYIHRTSAMRLYLWPVPDAAGTLTLQVHRLLADNDDGTKTLDLERHWSEYAVYAVSAKLALANSLPLSLVSKFERLAGEARDRAVAYSTPREPGQFYVNHRGWG